MPVLINISRDKIRINFHVGDLKRKFSILLMAFTSEPAPFFKAILYPTFYFVYGALMVNSSRSSGHDTHLRKFLSLDVEKKHESLRAINGGGLVGVSCSPSGIICKSVCLSLLLAIWVCSAVNCAILVSGIEASIFIDKTYWAIQTATTIKAEIIGQAITRGALKVMSVGKAPMVIDRANIVVTNTDKISLFCSYWIHILMLS